MFFSGSLQEGIALAVSEAKAVICFVRDDGETSFKWEEEYFFDDELKQLLATKAITLRLAKDSQEAGFLTSFCPVSTFPAVVVIKNGTLREYIVPEVSKDDFHSRLSAAMEDADATKQSNSNQSTAVAPVPAPAPEPQTASPVSVPSRAQVQQPPLQPQSEPTPTQVKTTQSSEPSTPQSSAPKSQPAKPKPKPAPEQKAQPKQETKPKINIAKRQPTVETVSEPTKPQPKPTPSPPRQYRLQVRLFDGSSIRSSFTPTQTIRSAVRPWIDSQIVSEEKRPYNLKHILTPLPNRTLTIAEEEQTLEELGLGSTANLVMVPINTYTEAYSSATSSLPVRAVSSAYGLVSSAAGIATGLVGSLLGYGPTTPAPSEASPAASTPSTPRPRPGASRGPNIRTLQDQREGQDDREFYNGNQLNFQPRGNNNQ